ncbi:MAG: dCMP deaminase [Actinobacteria bacterium 13_2_20CM_2_71_6]|nr:MAG: dCMP deaminase [Actinobacteria bacterium 13_2_20CM_2_71_6]
MTTPTTPTTVDREWLVAAIELSRLCPPVDTAYAVGAIVVGIDGRELSRGYSRENDPADHAEESALDKLSDPDVDLTDATLYSSLEPCSSRRSRLRTCTELIVVTGIRRVVFALHEPPLLADGRGVEFLEAAGVEVIQIPDLAEAVRRINANVLGSGSNS